jgi:DNA-directed RNA polymerase subunit RPC12/RpoP
MADGVQCSDCGADLAAIHTDAQPRVPCPNCGSTVRRFLSEATTSVRPMSMVRAVHKRPGVKRPLLDSFSGTRQGRDGRIVRVEQTIDRVNHRYDKHVQTEDGEILKDQHEDLRDHR